MGALVQERTNSQWLAALRPPHPAEQAVRDLCDYLQQALARVLRGRAGAVAADLDDFTQDALMRILEKLDHFRGDSRFTTWATAVAVRTALSSLRRRRFAQQPLDDLELGVAEPTGAAFERRELLEALRGAINTSLTEKQRSVILGELSGVPISILAERLGTNPNALYKLLHDARKKLKQALNDAGYSDADVRQELTGASSEA